MSNKQMARDMQVEFQARVSPPLCGKLRASASPVKANFGIVPSEAGAEGGTEGRETRSDIEEADSRGSSALCPSLLGPPSNELTSTLPQYLKKGETAKAYQKAKMLLSKQALAQQMDQMADMAELSSAQISANNAMNRMTHMMANSSRTMSVAQKNVNPEKVCIYPWKPCYMAASWLC